MNRKIWALLCFALALGVRLYQHTTGTAIDVNLLLEPLLILWVAFILPAMLQVILIERYWLHLEPWGDGNTVRTLLWMTLTASAFWFFPVGRIERWFGTFDPFTEGERRFPRLPSVSGTAANVLDKVSRLRVGKGKMGGWA